jgi:hypothetical protein
MCLSGLRDSEFMRLSWHQCRGLFIAAQHARLPQGKLTDRTAISAESQSHLGGIAKSLQRGWPLA